MPQPLESRPRYVPDGGMSAGRWPVLLAGALLAALAGGWLLHQLLVLRWYLVILVPGVVALVIALVLGLLVAWAHSRRPVFAALLGGSTGLCMYLASFYFGMVSQLPAGNAHRLDLLPGYILARLQTDVKHQVGKAQPQNQPAAKPRFGENVGVFSIELLLVVAFAAFPPSRRARRPYVVELGQWMAREEKRLPAGLLPEFRKFLQAGRLGDFVGSVARERAAVAKAQIARHYGSCVVEYLRDARASPLDYPVYLTFVNDAATWTGVFVRSRSALDQVQLEAAEVVALRPLFPHLNRILTGFQDQPRTTAKSRAGGSQPARRAAEPAAIEAVIEDVPQGETLRSGSFVLIINLLGAIPLFPFFGGLALFPVAAWGWFRGWGALPVAGCLVLGVVGFIVGALLGQRYPGLFEGWYARRRLYSLLALRGDAIVPTNDGKARMVNMTRRENWNKVQLDVRDDVGLLAIDEKWRELRIEGDKRRYRVPLEAVVLCQPECFHHPLDKKLLNQYWYVRLVVRLEAGERELLFAPTFDDWRPRTNENRKDLARRLCKRIEKVSQRVLAPA